MGRAIALQKKWFADWSDVKQTNTKSDIYYHLKWNLCSNKSQTVTQSVNEYPIRELSVEFIRNGFALTDGKQIRRNANRVLQFNQNIHFWRLLSAFVLLIESQIEWHFVRWLSAKVILKISERNVCLLPVIRLSRVLRLNHLFSEEMNHFLSNTLFNGLLKSPFNCINQFVRHFERQKFIRRFGYVQRSHCRGWHRFSWPHLMSSLKVFCVH